MNTEQYLQKMEVISVMNPRWRTGIDRWKKDTRVTMREGTNCVFLYVPRSPGDYELRVYTGPALTLMLSKKFYSYGNWGARFHNSF